MSCTVTSVQYLKSELSRIGKPEKFKQVWDLIVGCGDIEDIRPRFSPQSFESVKKAWDILQGEYEAKWKLEEAISEQIAKNTTWRDDEVLDEVDAFAVVYEEELIVTANEAGLGERIPKKNRKYIGSKGDMRWIFPLSELPAILNCSIISFVLNEDGSKLAREK
jgi:hypothetical protein